MNEKTLKVLMVEDNPAYADLLKELLSENTAKVFDIHHFDRLEAAMKYLDKETPDIILLDLFLPDSKGIDTVQTMTAKAASIPIVVLTGLSDEDAAVQAIRLGAQDFIRKGQIDAEVIHRVIDFAMERKKLLMMRDEFVNTASHELLTPLGILRESISSMRDGLAGAVNDHQRELLEMAIEFADRLIRTTRTLLDIAKMESGKLSIRRVQMDLIALIQDVKKSFKIKLEKHKLELHLELPGKELVIFADKDMIFRVFTNLINNAIKFTEKGSIQILVQDTGEYFECVVKDTGIGIAKENLGKVFSKYEQFSQKQNAAEKGTGLGLSICKSIVEAHHGQIRLESELGKGTSVIFTIPKVNLSAHQAT